MTSEIHQSEPHPGAVAPSNPAAIRLQIGGMTCAACAGRITKRLNQLDGVEATVNYATEQAVVHTTTPIDATMLIGEIRAIGYRAAPLPDPTRSDDDTRAEPSSGADDRGVPRHLLERLIGAAVLGIPVLALSMITAAQFDYWQWLTLTLAAPVVTWAAWPFHRAAALNARHGTATMDTLISVGTLAAFGWSVYALFRGGAGTVGMTMGFKLDLERGAGTGEIYLEVACAVIMFMLAGRTFEAHAKRRAGTALRALLELGAKDVAVIRDGVEHRIAIGQLAEGDRFVVRPGEKVATDGVVESGSSAIDASMLTGRVGPRRSRSRRPGHRCHSQRRRQTRRPRHQGRSRHRPRADHPARRRCPERQGADPTPRRSRRRRLRPDRDRHRVRDHRLLARARARRSRPRSPPASPC